jgi:opacity protein-like surface antigen
MNKPILMAMVGLVTLMGSAFALPAFQMVNAQGYGGGGSLQGGGIEQQLKLAREKVSAVQGAASIGLGNSGTPMLGTNINSTLLFIVAMVVIFGGVSVAFFIRARSPSKEATA